MSFRLPRARWVVLASAVVLSAVSLPGYAFADEELAAPPSGKVTLEVQTVNGSGCPAGTASVSMLSDNTGFRINYTDFRAEAGGTADPTDLRKNCQVNVLVNIPQGFTFAIARADYVGKAHLEAGATALERTNYYYQGSAENSYADHTYTGPYDGTWRATDITAAAALVWAPCGEQRALNINSELRVDSGSSTAKSWISMKASDGEVYTLVNLSWKSC